MKKILCIIFVSVVLFSCSKESEQADVTPPAIDYSRYKINTATHAVRNYNGTASTLSADTTQYIYEGSTYQYTTRISGTLQTATYSLSNGIYTLVQYNNGMVSNSKTYERLNAAGYVDSTWIINNGNITQSAKYYYHTDGNLYHAISNFSSYTNKTSYHYSNNVRTHIIAERISLTPSIPNALDSVVYEYASNLPYHAPIYSRGLPVSFYGKLTKNLVQKATSYDLLNNKAINRTTTYQYQTDDIGLVTKRIMNIYTQPGNNLIQTDTTAYTYYGK